MYLITIIIIMMQIMPFSSKVQSKKQSKRHKHWVLLVYLHSYLPFFFVYSGLHLITDIKFVVLWFHDGLSLITCLLCHLDLKLHLWLKMLVTVLHTNNMWWLITQYVIMFWGGGFCTEEPLTLFSLVPVYSECLLTQSVQETIKDGWM